MKQIRKRLTYANVMSSIAVFLILGGATAFAAGQLGKNTVGTKQLKKNSVTSAKIKNGAVTGAKVNLASLGTVPSATNANNASQLGGIPASGYTRNDCGSLTGQIKGFARINNASVSTTTLSTAGVETPYNCSGKSVLARRFSTGKYEVKFTESPVAIALATPLEASGSEVWDVNSTSVNRVGVGDFFIQIWNNPTNTFLSDSFAILTP
ncbi:MAG TPA: hypothetical protein VNY83_05655 [Solirubrobacterales bacterium]|nr:hypothetical protein [Solirubrobacterales bacterium]